jgi:beta-glucosidase-like glycosyl hydrolase
MGNKIFLFLIWSILTSVPLYAQTITINGTVKNAGGGGISGATVSLVVANLKATTAANGAYSITGNGTAALKTGKNLVITKPCFNGGSLFFGVPENDARVKIDVFDLIGRHVRTVLDQPLSRGNYRVCPFLNEISSQLCFLKIQIAGYPTVLKMPVLPKSGLHGGALTRVEAPALLAYFAKTSAAVDTLVVSAPGYQTADSAISSYTGTYNFVLSAANFGPSSPADGVLLTGTHRPTLTWNPSTNAVRYEVWLNISRADYDWAAPGPLIDRYTKVAEVTGGTSYQTDSLQDRWTYKWYVVAVDGSSGRSASAVRTFGIYNPKVTTVNDTIKIINGCRDLNKNGVIDPYEDWHNKPDARVADLMSKMSVEQKCMQLVYGDGANVGPGGGWFYFWPLDPARAMTNQVVSTRATFGIPYISAGDQIDGFKVVVPNQDMLTASRDNNMVYKCGDLFRRCMRVNGAFGNLGPLAEINTSYGYWRVQEGCGEDADWAASQMRALICGYHQGPELCPSSYLECLKHWPGQGAGGEASVKYDWVTIKWHMKSWKAAMEAGLEGVMPGYAGCALLQKAGRGAGDDPGIIGYLRDSLHYKGLITTDWLPSSAWVNAINAGSDVCGGAGFTEGVTTLSTAVDGGSISMARLDDACRKVLSAKFRMGIFENPYPLSPTQCDSAWASLRAEGIHIQAAREGLTLLKNNGVLPFSKLAAGDNIAVGGPLANSQNCTYIWYSGWNEGTKTFQWWVTERGKRNNVNVVAAAPAKAAVVFVGEAAYTHSGGAGSPPTQYDVSSAQALKNAGLPVVIVYIMPRPALVPEVAWADAMVVAYRPGDGGPQAIAEFLFGDFQPRGKLPWQLPKTKDQINADDPSLPYDMGASADQRTEIRSLIDQNKPVPATYGDPQFQWGFGLQSW